jgi:putative hemolysin
MEFIDPKGTYKPSSKLSFYGGKALSRFLMHLLQLKKVNSVYSKLSEESGIEFINKLLDALEIRFDVSNEDLKKIPSSGSFITVSNHPFGGLDGILLMKIISSVRLDIRLLSNSQLKKIAPLSDFFLSEDQVEKHASVSTLRDGLKIALQHLDNGNGLGIFPAGEVSGFDNYYNVVDREWQLSVIKMIKKSNVPVIPVYFSGSNSLFFHILGLIDPHLQTIKLTTELFNKKNLIVKVRIGSIIRPNEIDQFADIHKLGRYLRARTYSLANKDLEVKRFFRVPTYRKVLKVEGIVPPIERKILLSEIENIKNEYALFSLKNFTVFCAPTKRIPSILNEIGRLREITFRAVGEGTNHLIDIDEYDLYYNHLFIWDNDEDCIVGAYRIGMGREIIQQYGIKGFYIESLFRIKNKFTSVLNQSLELGRSFVVQEYQRKPLPLFLLWKGILYFLLKNPHYRYLLGPVSISNDYSPVSKDSIIRFIKTNYFDSEKARYIRPRKAYKFVSENPDINLLLDNAGDDLNKFDRLIGDIDKVNNGIPVLLKKYLSLNARILAFNVDPNFNNCLDGLIVLDILKVPLKTIESLSKEVNDGSILERFYSSRELIKTDEPARI